MESLFHSYMWNPCLWNPCFTVVAVSAVVYHRSARTRSYAAISMSVSSGFILYFWSVLGDL